jgi:hypothetical protein
MCVAGFSASCLLPNPEAAGAAKTLRVQTTSRPGEGAWLDYQIIMWQGHTRDQYAALKQLGITASETVADRSNEAQSRAKESLMLANPAGARTLQQVGLSWYVDNIATDFYAPYHYMSSNALFRRTRALYQANPADISAITREPSLSDPLWMQRVRTRIGQVVEAQRAYSPLFYNLADEPGIADTSAAWDFDFSPASLEGLRQWLRRQYGTLAALNREWETHFTSWDEVMPSTTPQAMQRTDGNFSAWADFKSWMDVSFARAIRAGTDAVHLADPRAHAAITGGQTPGPGGYDYSLLADAVDLIEPYDFGGNVDILHSLNPDMVILTTSFAGGDRERHRVWRELIHGTGGLILWEDPDKKFLHDDGTLDERGRQAAPYFAEIRGGLGALVIASRAAPGQLAILYSPASMRTEWMLKWQPKGDAWSRNGTSSAGDDNGVNLFGNLAARVGVAHEIVSPQMVEKGALQNRQLRALVLPHSYAMSSGEAAAIRDFVRGGGTVIADSEPALYDEHSRKLGSPALAQIFRGAPGGAETVFSYGRGKGIYFVPTATPNSSASVDAASVRAFAEVLKEGGIVPDLDVRDSSDRPPNGIEMNLLGNGRVKIAALQRELPPRNGEAEAAVQELAAEKLSLVLPRPAYVYDLRKRTSVGQIARIELSLGAIEPELFAISDTPLPAPRLSTSARARMGEPVEVSVSLGDARDTSTHIVHLDVVSPTGETILAEARNVRLSAGGSSKLQLRPRDGAGVWKLRAIDVLSGQTAEAEFAVVEN